MKRIISGMLAAAVLVSSGVAFGQMGPAKKELVTVSKVVLVPNLESRRYTGLVVSPATVNAVSRVSGDLLEVGFVEGDFVRKGQLLYALDSVRFEAEVKSAEAKVAEETARLAYSKNNYERINSLFEKNVTTRDEMENALSDYNATKANLMAAEASLALAQDDLKNSKIYAAIDGKIGATNYTVGNYITPSSGVLATVVQLNPIRVKFSISNRDFLQMFGTADVLKAKGHVRIVLANDAIYTKDGQPVIGELDFIDNTANRNTDTVQMYFKFANDDFVLIPQSTVKVLLEKLNDADVPSIAPSAVMVAGNSPYVYVVDEGGIVARRDVVLGSVNGDSQLILSGLEAGEVVIVEGVHKVRPGVAVEVTEK